METWVECRVRLGLGASLQCSRGKVGAMSEGKGAQGCKKDAGVAGRPGRVQKLFCQVAKAYVPKEGRRGAVEDAGLMCCSWQTCRTCHHVPLGSLPLTDCLD